MFPHIQDSLHLASIVLFVGLLCVVYMLRRSQGEQSGWDGSTFIPLSQFWGYDVEETGLPLAGKQRLHVITEDSVNNSLHVELTAQKLSFDSNEAFEMGRAGRVQTI